MSSGHILQNFKRTYISTAVKAGLTLLIEIKLGCYIKFDQREITHKYEIKSWFDRPLNVLSNQYILNSSLDGHQASTNNRK